MKPNRPSSLLDRLKPVDAQPLTPKICDGCYQLLLEAIIEHDHHDFAAVHCPHYMVLMQVELHEGTPLGTILSGPITPEEAESKLHEQFAHE